MYSILYYFMEITTNVGFVLKVLMLFSWEKPNRINLDPKCPKYLQKCWSSFAIHFNCRLTKKIIMTNNKECLQTKEFGIRKRYRDIRLSEHYKRVKYRLLADGDSNPGTHRPNSNVMHDHWVKELKRGDMRINCQMRLFLFWVFVLIRKEKLSVNKCQVG